MFKFKISLFLFFFLFLFSLGKSVLAESNIVYTNEDSGFWYLDFQSSNRYYIKDPLTAFLVLRDLSLGVNSTNMKKFQEEGAPLSLSGRILLDIEANGEAYYVNPADLSLNYLGEPSKAFAFFKSQAQLTQAENVQKFDVGRFLYRKSCKLYPEGYVEIMR